MARDLITMAATGIYKHFNVQTFYSDPIQY